MAARKQAVSKDELVWELQRKLENLYEGRDDGYQRYVYHYTNEMGLRGILTSNKLWATDYRYQNDASEQTYAPDKILKPLVVEALKATSSTVAKQLLRRLKDVSPVEFLPCYLTCFSKTNRLLNQWLVYAGNAGYAIEFDTAGLSSLLGGTTWRRAIYDEDEQRLVLRQAIEVTVAFVEEKVTSLPAKERKDFVGACRGKLARHLVEVMLAFKHPEFKVEEEIRLIARSEWASEVQYRKTNYGRAPYLALYMDDAGKLPIKSITYAPTAEPKKERAKLKRLLKECGYDSKKTGIDGVNIPIRPIAKRRTRKTPSTTPTAS